MMLDDDLISTQGFTPSLYKRNTLPYRQAHSHAVSSLTPGGPGLRPVSCASSQAPCLDSRFVSSSECIPARRKMFLSTVHCQFLDSHDSLLKLWNLSGTRLEATTCGKRSHRTCLLAYAVAASRTCLGGGTYSHRSIVRSALAPCFRLFFH